MNENNHPDETQHESRLEAIFKATSELFSLSIKSIIFTAAFIMFVAQVSIVNGHSMEPNLHTEQRVLIDKLSYEFQEPARGDVVVVEVPDSEVPLIKRIIGLPGETIEIRDNQVFINGALFTEAYLHNIRQSNYGPVTVPAEHVFVMGDNRSASRDSRAFGSVDQYRIIGKVKISLWPPGIIE